MYTCADVLMKTSVLCSKSQTSAAHLALAMTNIALGLKKPWLLNIDDMYIWRQGSKRLGLPIRWAEWKSVMLSPRDIQLVWGRGREAVRETLGERRRRWHGRWDGAIATWSWAEWKIVMPVAVGERERDAATTFGRRCGWPLLLANDVRRSACPWSPRDIEIWMVCPKVLVICERNGLAWRWQWCIWNKSISPHHMDSSWK